jgi:hypothetical protein
MIGVKFYCFTIVFPDIVTAPLRARALPFKVAPVLKEIDCIAIIVPLKEEVVPKVAELPTCQKILDAKAPPANITCRPDVTVSAEAIWIINTAPGFPFASKVTLPEDKARVEVDLYNPGVKVSPPIFPAKVTISILVLPAASL